MIHWQLGHKDAAHRCLSQAVGWMEKNQPNNQELRRLRAEAEAQIAQVPASTAAPSTDRTERPGV
jgi:hypothetical protein